MVSIIIPIHNWARAENCLREIRKQTYPSIEIITVEFKGFPAEKRNYGFRKSKGEYVYFLDEDEYISPTVVEECVAKSEEGYGLIAVPVVKKLVKSYIARCISITRESTFKWMFFKRCLLEDIGLFDPRFILCDDLDILQRVIRSEYKIGAISDGCLFHDEDVGLGGIMRKTILARGAFRKLKTKYGKSTFRSIVRTRFHRRRIARELLEKPKHIPGVALIMFMRFIIRRIP